MGQLLTGRRIAGWALAAIFVWSSEAPAETNAAPQDAAAVARGRYIFAAGGCSACHTDSENLGAPLAGGRALATPYGTFYSPNITPDRSTGIGGWTEAQFFEALRHGLGPDGRPLYPAFPYTSYSMITEGDARDLYTYLMSLPPVDMPNRQHEIGSPYNWRSLLYSWQRVFFQPGPKIYDTTKSPEWNRGRYLVEALCHCGECHTPRGPLGDLDRRRALAGNPDGPDGIPAPNLTPGSDSFAQWQVDDIVTFLGAGITLKGTYASGPMAEVVRESTSLLTDADRRAIAAYLKELPAIP